MKSMAVVVGSAVVIFILSVIMGGGAVLATNAWQAADKTADFGRNMLGSSALWYGRSVYYRWTGGFMVLLGTCGLVVFLGWLIPARSG